MKKMLTVVFIFLLISSGYCSERNDDVQSRAGNSVKEHTSNGIGALYAFPCCYNNFETGYLVKVKLKGKSHFEDRELNVYRIYYETGKRVLIYREKDFRLTVVGIIPIQNGFIIVKRFGMGRHFYFDLYIEENETMKKTSFGMYDFIEPVYYEDGHRMPYLFCTLVANSFIPRKEDNLDFSYTTNVLKWDVESKSYKLEMRIDEKTTRFSDRFKVINKDYYFISPYNLFTR